MKDVNRTMIQYFVLILGAILFFIQIFLIVVNVNEYNKFNYRLIKIIVGIIFSIGIILQSIRSWLAREIATIIFIIVFFCYISFTIYYGATVVKITMILAIFYFIIDNIKEFKKSNWFSILRYKYFFGIRNENAIVQYYDWLFYKKKYKKILDINNRFTVNDSINFYLGASYILLGYNEEGRKQLIKIEKDSKYENEIRYLIGISKYNQGMFEKALEEFNAYLNCEPENYNVIKYRAISRIKMGKYEEAISDFTRLIEQKQNVCENLYNRSICKYNLEKFDDAELDLKECTMQKKPFVEIFLKLAEIAIKKNEIDNAIEYYYKAIKFDKNLKNELKLQITNLKNSKRFKTI